MDAREDALRLSQRPIFCASVPSRSCFHCPEHVALICLPGTKVFVMPNGMLKSNQQLVDIIEKVKPEIRLLIEKCNTVRRAS